MVKHINNKKVALFIKTDIGSIDIAIMITTGAHGLIMLFIRASNSQKSWGINNE